MSAVGFSSPAAPSSSTPNAWTYRPRRKETSQQKKLQNHARHALINGIQHKVVYNFAALSTNNGIKDWKVSTNNAIKDGKVSYNGTSHQEGLCL